MVSACAGKRERVLARVSIVYHVRGTGKHGEKRLRKPARGYAGRVTGEKYAWMNKLTVNRIFRQTIIIYNFI